MLQTRTDGLERTTADGGLVPLRLVRRTTPWVDVRDRRTGEARRLKHAFYEPLFPSPTTALEALATAPTPHQPPRRGAALSARQAAAALGVNEKTVRRWIERGRLSATKDDAGAYRIDPDELARHRAADAADTPHQGAAPAAPMSLQPLVDLVADLTRRNAGLTEAATLWQFRARQAEEQVKQLTAGGDARQDARVDATAAPGSTEGPERSPETLEGEGVSWVVRAWRWARRGR